MPFSWFQSKLKKPQSGEPGVHVHQATPTVFGPVPWTIWHDSGLELVCEEGRDAGLCVPLDHGFQVIGRGLAEGAPRAGWLLFTEETVSRRQAVLCWSQDRDAFFLYHLHGATNETYVNETAGDCWRVGIGTNIDIGHMRIRIQRKLQMGRLSPFVLSTLERLGRAFDDAPLNTGFALTVVDGTRKGDTWLLSRKFHILHSTPGDSGEGLLDRSMPHATERDLLVWYEEAQTYGLIHNEKADGTIVHAAHPSHSFQIFSPASETSVEVCSDTPVILREGDILRIGALQVRIHRQAGKLLDGSIAHILSKGYIEKIPSPDVLIERAPHLSGTHPSADAAPRRDTPTMAPPADPRREAPRESHPLSGDNENRPTVNPPSPLRSTALSDAMTPTVRISRIPLGSSPASASGGSAAPPSSSTAGSSIPPPAASSLPRPSAGSSASPSPRRTTPAARPVEAGQPPSVAPPRKMHPPAFSGQPPGESEAYPSAPRSSGRMIRIGYELEVVTMGDYPPGTRLVIDGHVRVYAARTPRISLGRGEENDVTHPGDYGLSDLHAAIEFSEHGLLLRPIQGRAMVNGEPISETICLHDDDEIRLTRSTVLRVKRID